MGYEGLWKKRTNELFDEGEATFYKTSRFTVVESNTYSLADLANKVKSCVLLKMKLKYLLHEEMHLSLFSTGIYFILLQSQNRETWLSKLLAFLGYTCNRKLVYYIPPSMRSIKLKKRYIEEFYLCSTQTWKWIPHLFILDLIKLQEMDDGLDPTQKEAIQGYLDRPDVMVLVKLRCNSTGQIVTVGNIHVHWGQMKLPDVQCIQVSGSLFTIVIVKNIYLSYMYMKHHTRSI